MVDDRQPVYDIAFIKNLEQFFKELKIFAFGQRLDPVDFSKHQHQRLWFRGQSNVEHVLVPKLYRKHDFSAPTSSQFWKDIQEKEQFYLKDFRTRNYHLVPRFPENDLLWMSLMQHNGTPTRLLDWSENALSACFFAVENYYKGDNKTEKRLPCVWCLKPMVLNQLTIKICSLHLSAGQLPDLLSLLPRPHAVDTDLSRLEHCPNLRATFFGKKDPTGTRPTTRTKEVWPLAVLPQYNNERVRAQSGTFTLFPLSVSKNITKLEDVALEWLPQAEKFLKLFIFVKPAEITYELNAIGLKQAMIYPEMPSSEHDIEHEIN